AVVDGPAHRSSVAALCDRVGDRGDRVPLLIADAAARPHARHAARLPGARSADRGAADRGSFAAAAPRTGYPRPLSRLHDRPAAAGGGADPAGRASIRLSSFYLYWRGRE